MFAKMVDEMASGEHDAAPKVFLRFSYFKFESG
jgi:hypothetical protein